jgi:hypothetical protein
LFAWLLLRLKQPQQTWCLVTSKMQFNFGGAHANSRSAREFGEAAPACFLKFCVYVHSVIHLHCARKQCKFTCTVNANSASELHCAREQCKWNNFFQTTTTTAIAIPNTLLISLSRFLTYNETELAWCINLFVQDYRFFCCCCYCLY